MEKNEKSIICRFDNAFIDSIFFSYLSPNERNEINERIANKSSVVCGFEIGGVIIFCVVFDLHEKESRLHVREVGGMFTKDFDAIAGYKFLNQFCEGFAKATNLKHITFHGERPAHEKLYESFGFEKTGENDFMRRIH